MLEPLKDLIFFFSDVMLVYGIYEIISFIWENWIWEVNA